MGEATYHLALAANQSLCGHSMKDEGHTGTYVQRFVTCGVCTSYFTMRKSAPFLGSCSISEILEAYGE
jgi:hypothetical protein